MRIRTVTFSFLLALPALYAGGAFAMGAGPTPGVLLSGMRFWTAPASTRIVIDFSTAVTPVSPDSGSGRELVVTIPGELIERAPSVPRILAVRDGVVDSVQAETSVRGAQFRLWFRDSSRYRVFSLPAEQDKPFRLVVDVTRPAAAAAEDRRLAGIAAAKKHERVRIVAIDPGHGGEDTGARGPRGVLEKNTNLAVARALAAELNAMTGIKAVLTRDGDYFIPLRERYRAGERMKADLFVSIHANSSKRRGSGRGTEVYFLSLRGANDQADADLANLENAADLVGGVPPQAEDDLVNILYDVKRSSALQQSQLLADALLDHIASERLESRGVKQAGFVVLKSVEFPSVLVETAFINNPVEAKLLADPTFQRKMGRQLAEGIRDYFQKAGIGLAKPDDEAANQAMR